MKDRDARARFLQGHLYGLLENTEGGKDELKALILKAVDGAFVWTGKSPRRKTPPVPPRRK